MNNTTKLRQTSFDFIKFIAMSFVLIGHVLQRWSESGFTSSFGFSFIYSVSLALFFFTGGFFIKRVEKFTDWLIYLLKLFIHYIIPAFLFTCLSIWLLPRFADHDFAFWMEELYFRTDTFYWYFLTAFFINSSLALTHYFASIIIRKKNLLGDLLRTLISIFLLLLYALIFINIYNNPQLGPTVLSANMLLYYLPIAFFGFLYRTFQKYFVIFRYSKFINIGIFIIALAGYITALSQFPHWLAGLQSDFWTITWHMLGALAGTIIYLYLAIEACQWRVMAKIAEVGQLSGPFYLVHVFLVRLLATYLPRPSVFNSSTILFLVLLTLGFYLASLGITYGLVKIPITNMILFGDYHGWVVFKKWWDQHSHKKVSIPQ